MISIRPGHPAEPGAARLLQASQALMQSLFPPEDNFFLSAEALAGPDIRFFVACEGATEPSLGGASGVASGPAILGTGALAIRADYGEVKSMFTDPAARGRGIAQALLDRIEAEARALSLPVLRLETGNLLTAAHRLYARAGFRPRGPFGSYPDAATSLFLEKPLT